ncbi:serine hydrolase [Ferdinandcohnia quinoae]|uniref:Class A beta-lactamase-related serine hydrolase n=1 Tax=Fredinandcohnia quinoae TaxID=2918902 RepID=A0AAW5E6D8_9BACI|nr:serine hydrolase [Fredinandcohnia sp. SECRCQ15]MCH1626449.1 class A beta-lactamase-related serine hydrolase [Fredinandcohnia sp. SECRCQ15]
MEKVIEKVKEIDIGDLGIIIYSQKQQRIISSLNSNLVVPLASAAKVAIGYCIAKWIEDGLYTWDDIMMDIHFNPDENSHQLYPHLQQRRSLALRDAVEVMIACHDSFLAKNIVSHCGGWDLLNLKIQAHFTHITVTENPRDMDNNGELGEIHKLICSIYQGYQKNPELWLPVIIGLVRQNDEIEGIPGHLLNHMTGGLEDVIVDIGIVGEFNSDPLLYALGAKGLPNRYVHQESDKKIIETMKLLYAEYLSQG